MHVFYVLSLTTYKQFHAKAHAAPSDTHTHGSSLYCMILIKFQGQRMQATMIYIFLYSNLLLSH